jgi:hypothetical protein
MADPHRITKSLVELIDLAVQHPSAGADVLALTIGGILVQTTWKPSNARHYEAWAYKPKIPTTVKERMTSRYVRN